MSEPRITSFQGDRTIEGDRAERAAEDPEVVAAIREVERLLREPRRSGAMVFRVGPNVLGRRPTGSP
jgi:hypothetical protein